jgi:hypothetical protein
LKPRMAVTASMTFEAAASRLVPHPPNLTAITAMALFAKLVDDPIVRRTATEVLAGLVELITFHNQENGFCVLRVKVRGQRDLITVVGHAASIAAGEWVQMTGGWNNERTHGLQFKADFLKASPPTTLEGIERYLGSGMIRGIGSRYARRLVAAFGEKVLDLIEQQPDRLQEVPGIGPKQIIAGWAQQKVVREIMLFLHANASARRGAVRIYKTYGIDAVQVISANPYRLARNIGGIGFVSADRIAEKLGIEKTAMVRVRAGVSYALAEALDEGHCGLPVRQPSPLGPPFAASRESVIANPFCFDPGFFTVSQPVRRGCPAASRFRPCPAGQERDKSCSRLRAVRLLRARPGKQHAGVEGSSPGRKTGGPVRRHG